MQFIAVSAIMRQWPVDEASIFKRTSSVSASSLIIKTLLGVRISMYFEECDWASEFSGLTADEAAERFTDIIVNTFRRRLQQFAVDERYISKRYTRCNY